MQKIIIFTIVVIVVLGVAAVAAGTNMSIYPETGFAARHTTATSNFQNIFEYTLCPVQPEFCASRVTIGSMSPQELARQWTTGVVFGGGVDLHFGRFHFGPEL